MKNPTIAVFQHREAIIYPDQYEQHKVKQWIENLPQHVLIQVKNDKNFDEVADKWLSVLLVFDEGKEEKDIVIRYNSLALNYPNVTFGFTSEEKYRE